MSEMDDLRHYSTIGIEGFVCGPSDPHPPSYPQIPTSDQPPETSFTSWEITGIVKERPEDFVVREILPQDDPRVSQLLSYSTAVRNSAEGNVDGFDKDIHELNIAALSPRPTIVLPSNSKESNQSSHKPIECISVDEEPREKMNAEKIISHGKSMESTPDSDFSSSNRSPFHELSLEETIRVYIEKVQLETPGRVLLNAIKKLNEKAVNRIPTSHSDKNEIAVEIQMPEGGEDLHNLEVWIPPLHFPVKNAKTDLPITIDEPISDDELRRFRGQFHRAIRITYPFLKTESCSFQQCDDGLSKSSSNSSNHWIKIEIDDSFDELVKFLCAPRDDLRQLFLFRNRGFEGASARLKFRCSNTSIANPSSHAILRLRPGLSKDDRRTVHHILAMKNKHFESSVRNQVSKKKNCPGSQEEKDEKTASENLSATTDLVVTWKKAAIQKVSKKNSKKRKRFEKNMNNTSDDKIDKNLLCVLKKTQKEHLTTMQILSRSLRCRQSDIGFAGIKDMQAITYQFITLRNMGQRRVERVIKRQLQNRGIELKILFSNIDLHLNIGDLEGNQFEITVRNLKRIKVSRESFSKMNDISEPAKESFVDCDKAHIEQMVKRIKQHGFINFYGEQRVGAPGNSDKIGVRAFEIGCAMLRQDFMGAIKYLMEGTRHNESDETRRIRKAWRDSNGDPSITLKAFRGADIMPRERAVLRGLNRYPENPLEAIRYLSYNMRIFYINAYQSYIFNRVASRRVALYGQTAVRGDLYFDKDGDNRGDIKIIEGGEIPPIKISQVVLPLPGYNVQYPKNEIGKLYRDILENDRVKFEKDSVPEATANGSYRKLIVYPRNLSVETDSSDSLCKSMTLSFQLPKGSYATMLLRELMLTTVARPRK